MEYSALPTGSIRAANPLPTVSSMIQQRHANIAFTLLTLAAVLYFGYVALGFKVTGLLATSGLSSSFFPLTILGFIAVCAVIVLGQYCYSAMADAKGDQQVFLHRTAAIRGIMTIAVSIAGFLVWRSLGFIEMALLIGPVCALVMGSRSKIELLLLSVSGFLIYFLFSNFLGIQFN